MQSNQNTINWPQNSIDANGNSLLIVDGQRNCWICSFRYFDFYAIRSQSICLFCSPTSYNEMTVVVFTQMYFFSSIKSCGFVLLEYFFFDWFIVCRIFFLDFSHVPFTLMLWTFHNETNLLQLLAYRWLAHIRTFLVGRYFFFVFSLSVFAFESINCIYVDTLFCTINSLLAWRISHVNFSQFDRNGIFPIVNWKCCVVFFSFFLSVCVVWPIRCVYLFESIVWMTICLG